jgi:hypothetical protein
LARTNPGLIAATLKPTHVYAFRGEGSFKYYRSKRFENAAGYSITGSDRDVIAYNANPEGSEESEVLYHEFIHGYLRNNLAGLPLWPNEGLACYYSTFRPGDASADIGHPLGFLSQWCRDHQLLPIPELIAFSSESPDYRRATERRTTFYAQSWLLVHYLFHSSEENSRKFESFLASLSRGRDAGQSFAEAFPEQGWSTLLTAIKNYNERSEFEYLRYRFEERFDPAEVHSRPMARVEVLYQLGALLFTLGDRSPQSAEEHFQAVLVRDSSHAPSIASLGVIADQRGETKVAEELLARAMSVTPANARACALAGRVALERSLRSPPPSTAAADSVPPLMLTARRRFAACLQLEPDDLEALAGFGKTFVYDRDPSSGAIAALKRASAALPARSDILWDLFWLEVGAGRREEAQSLLHGKLDSRLDAEQAAEAEAMLAQLAQPRARNLEREQAEGDSSAAPLTGARPSGVQAAGGRGAARDLLERGDEAGRQGHLEVALKLFAGAREAAAQEGDRDVVELADTLIANVRMELRNREGDSLLSSNKPRQARAAFKEVAESPAASAQSRRYAQRMLKVAEGGDRGWARPGASRSVAGCQGQVRRRSGA